jgi:ankyrin repeat protein
MCWAAETAQKEVVKILLSKLTTTESAESPPALVLACRRGDLQLVQAMLEVGQFSADRHVSVPVADGNALDEWAVSANGASAANNAMMSSTPLFEAVKAQQLSIVEWLLAIGVDVNKALTRVGTDNEDVPTPLTIALNAATTTESSVGRAIVWALLDHGANYHGCEEKLLELAADAVSGTDVEYTSYQLGLYLATAEPFARLYVATHVILTNSDFISTIDGAPALPMCNLLALFNTKGGLGVETALRQDGAPPSFLKVHAPHSSGYGKLKQGAAAIIYARWLALRPSVLALPGHSAANGLVVNRATLAEALKPELIRLRRSNLPNKPPPNFDALKDTYIQIAGTCNTPGCVRAAVKNSHFCDKHPSAEIHANAMFGVHWASRLQINTTETQTDDKGEYIVYILTVVGSLAVNESADGTPTTPTVLDDITTWTVSYRYNDFKRIHTSLNDLIKAAQTAEPCEGATPFEKHPELPTLPTSSFPFTVNVDKRRVELTTYVQEINTYLRLSTVAATAPAALEAFRTFLKEPTSADDVVVCILNKAEEATTTTLATAEEGKLTSAPLTVTATSNLGTEHAAPSEHASENEHQPDDSLQALTAASFIVGQDVQTQDMMLQKWWDGKVVEVHEASVTVRYPKVGIGWGFGDVTTTDFAKIRFTPMSNTNIVAAVDGDTTDADVDVMTEPVPTAHADVLALTPAVVMAPLPWYESSYKDGMLAVNLRNEEQEHGIHFKERHPRAQPDGTLPPLILRTGAVASREGSIETLQCACEVDTAGRSLVNPVFMKVSSDGPEKVLRVDKVDASGAGYCVGVRPGMCLATVNGVAVATKTQLESVLTSARSADGTSNWVTMEFVPLPDELYTNVIPSNPAVDYQMHQDAANSLLLLSLNTILNPSWIPHQLRRVHDVLKVASKAAGGELTSDEASEVFEGLAGKIWLHFNELLNLGADINCRDEHSHSPLHIIASNTSWVPAEAYQFGSVMPPNYLLKWILRNPNIDVNQFNGNDQVSALQAACGLGILSTVQTLITYAGAEPNAVSSAPATTALMLAMHGTVSETANTVKSHPYCNFMATAKYLIHEAGADVNGADIKGVTPLLLICKHAPDVFAMETLWWLIENGADPTLADAEGCFPLLAICEKNPSFLADLTDVLTSRLFGTANGYKLRADMIRLCLGMEVTASTAANGAVQEVSNDQAVARRQGIEGFKSTINRADKGGRSVLLVICEDLADWDLAIMINQQFEADPILARASDHATAYSIAKAAGKKDVAQLFASYGSVRVTYPESAPQFDVSVMIPNFSPSLFNLADSTVVNISTSATHRYHFVAEQPLPVGLLMDRQTGMLTGTPAPPEVLSVVTVTLVRTSNAGEVPGKIVGRSTLSIRIMSVSVAARANLTLNARIAGRNTGGTSLHVNSADLSRSSVHGLMAMARSKPTLSNWSLPYIVYHDTTSGQQQGIDAGGVFRDWLFRTATDLFAPTTGLFVEGDAEGDAGLGPFLRPVAIPRDQETLDPLPDETAHKFYWLAGHLIALSLCTDVPLGVRVAPYLLKHLQGKKDAIKWDDYQQHSFAKHKHFTETLDPAKTPEEVDELCEYVLCMTFSADSHELKHFNELQQANQQSGTMPTRQESDLVVDGNEKQVTHENVREYLNMLTTHDLVKGAVGSAGKSMRDGLIVRSNNTVRNLLRSRTAEQLSRLISGPKTLDVRALRAHTTVSPAEHRLSANERASLGYFWQYLEVCNSDERLAVFSFWTGLGAQPALWPRIKLSIKPGQRDQHMPCAHTCFYALELPVYSSQAICAEKVGYAAANGGTFALA